MASAAGSWSVVPNGWCWPCCWRSVVGCCGGSTTFLRCRCRCRCRCRSARPQPHLHRYPKRRRPRPSRSPCRSEEHTSELQSLMRISYAVFCLKKKKKQKINIHKQTRITKTQKEEDERTHIS